VRGAATEGFHASEEQLVTGGRSDGQVHVVVAVVLPFCDEGGLLSAQPAHPVTNWNLAPAGVLTGTHDEHDGGIGGEDVAV
jgi:hypothetical protein